MAHPLLQDARDRADCPARAGRIRLNGQRAEKAGTEVKPGDTLTLPRGREVVAVRVVALGSRRGPAAETLALYEVLTESVLDPAPPRP